MNVVIHIYLLKLWQNLKRCARSFHEIMNLSSEEKVIKRRTNFQILFFHPFSLTILHIGLVQVVQILFCVLFVGLLSGSKVLKANNYECVQRICIYRLLHYYTMSRQNSICNNVYNKTYTKSDRKYMCRQVYIRGKIFISSSNGSLTHALN